MKKSGYLQKLEKKNELKYAVQFDKKMDILQQICIDASFMAASDVFQMGPGRCEKFGQALVDYIHEIAEILNDDAKQDMDLTYSKGKIDERLKKICGDKFDCWEDRYNGRK